MSDSQGNFKLKFSGNTDETPPTWTPTTPFEGRVLCISTHLEDNFQYKSYSKIVLKFFRGEVECLLSEISLEGWRLFAPSQKWTIPQLSIFFFLSKKSVTGTPIYICFPKYLFLKGILGDDLLLTHTNLLSNSFYKKKENKFAGSWVYQWNGKICLWH